MADTRRLQLGRRLQVYIDPRDAWIGVYVAPAAVYVLPVPFLVLRWDRTTPDPGTAPDTGGDAPSGDVTTSDEGTRR